MGKGAHRPQEEPVGIFLCCHIFQEQDIQQAQFNSTIQSISSERRNQNKYQKVVCYREKHLVVRLGPLACCLGWIYYRPTLIFSLFGWGWGTGAGVRVEGGTEVEQSIITLKNAKLVKLVIQLFILQITSWLTELNLFWCLLALVLVHMTAGVHQINFIPHECWRKYTDSWCFCGFLFLLLYEKILFIYF